MDATARLDQLAAAGAEGGRVIDKERLAQVIEHIEVTGVLASDEIAVLHELQGEVVALLGIVKALAADPPIYFRGERPIREYVCARCSAWAYVDAGMQSIHHETWCYYPQAVALVGPAGERDEK
jgi:non-ribosomal peptide synthetase component F